MEWLESKLGSIVLLYPDFFPLYTFFFSFFLLLILEIYVYSKLNESKKWILILLPKIQYFFILSTFFSYYVLALSLTVILYLKVIDKVKSIELIFVFIVFFEAYIICYLSWILMWCLIPIYIW